MDELAGLDVLGALGGDLISGSGDFGSFGGIVSGDSSNGFDSNFGLGSLGNLGSSVFGGGSGLIPDSGPLPSGGGLGGVQTMGGAVAGLGGMAAIIGQLWVRLRGAMSGVTAGSLSSFGTRIWTQVTTWVRANPGTSAIALLTGLGLTAEQAAQFLAWGATRRRKKRTRGISGRDVRVARRTIRKINSLYHLIHSGTTRRGTARRFGARAGGVQVVRAG